MTEHTEIPLDVAYDAELDAASGVAEALLNDEFGMSSADIDAYLEGVREPPLTREQEYECRYNADDMDQEEQEAYEEQMFGRILTDDERSWVKQTGEMPDAMPSPRTVERHSEPKEHKESKKPKKPKKPRKKKDDPPEDQLLVESADEEPDDEDKAFVNEDAQLDVAIDGRVVSKDNIHPVFVEDEEGRRRSTRKRKAPEFFGVDEEEKLFRKYAEDDAADCEKYNEPLEPVEEEAEVDDEVASSYVPTDDDGDPELSSDDDSGSGDSYLPEAAFMLFGADKQGPLFMAVDVDGLILESSEDCIGNMETCDAFTSVFGKSTKIVTYSPAHVVNFYNTVLTTLPEDKRAPLASLTEKVVDPDEIKDEEWFAEIGKAFFIAHG